ncbi:MAG: DJ-1/PfpI family protein [Endozoicomonas sp.]|uniref:DJ-1/PfpI family protein n=1 Tax=Endozoicomonas sp. TaxID=1892382 RepID=UPI003D9BCA10
MKKKVLVLLYPGCIEYEIKAALELLANQCEIHVTAPVKGTLPGSTGLLYQINMSFEEALKEHFDCLLVPGGDPGSVVENQALSQLLKNASQSGSVIGAVCAGPLLLAIAGILKGRQQTNAAYYPDEMAHVWEGSQFIREQVVIDQNIVTALPEAHIDFAAETGWLMGVFEHESQKARWQEYYKGIHQRDWSLSGVVRD